MYSHEQIVYLFLTQIFLSVKIRLEVRDSSQKMESLDYM